MNKPTNCIRVISITAMKFLGLALGLACVGLLLAAFNTASAQAPEPLTPAGIGSIEEGAASSAGGGVVKLPSSPGIGPAALDSLTIHNGAFHGPTPWPDGQAPFYKAKAEAIKAGDFTSQDVFLPNQITSWPPSYEEGAMAYVTSVITGLEQYDIVHKIYNQYWTDDYTTDVYTWFNGGDFYILIDDYDHISGTDSIYDWLHYIVNESDGSYTLVTGQGVYELVGSPSEMDTAIGLGMRTGETLEVYEDATLLTPTLSSRGYTYSTDGISGGTLVRTATYTNYQDIVARPTEVWVDDDWAGHDCGEMVAGHLFCYDAFAVIQDAVDAVASGGTVHVQAGTYTAIDRALAIIGKPLTLSGAGQTGDSNGPILEGGAYGTISDTTGLGTDWPRAIVVQTNTVTINNLRIANFQGSDPENGTPGGYGIVARAQAAWGVTASSIDDLVVEDVTFEDVLIGVRAQSVSNTLVQSTTYVINDGLPAYAQYVNSSDGTTIRANILNGGCIWVTGATHAVIGGPNPADGNTVTGGIYNGIWLGQQFAAGTSSEEGLIQNNTVNGAVEGGIVIWNWPGETANNIRILDNTVSGAAGGSDEHGGISIRQGIFNNLTIRGNKSSNNSANQPGLLIDGATLNTPDISHNVFRDNPGPGIRVAGSTSGVAAHSNIMCNNGDYELENTTGNEVDASGNWWGHNVPIQSGTDYSGLVSIDPNVERTLTTSSDHVDPAGGSTLIASVVYTDAATYSVPDGTVITWTVTGGTPASLTSTVGSGVASVGVIDDASAGMTISAEDCCGFSQDVTLLAGRVNNLDTGEWFATIQSAIDDADTLDGHTLLATSGTYTENVTIDKGITLRGEGMGSTIIYPAVSDVGSPDPPSFQASQVIVVEANNVSIEYLTVDGNNPTISSGVTINGVDVDARNGIIQDYNTGVWDGLVVHDVEVANCYLRGIYAVPPGGQALHGVAFYDNVVRNVAGLHDDSVGILARGSINAVLRDNRVEDTMRGVGCFAGSSCLVQGNVITDALDSGIYVSWNLDAYYTITGTTLVTGNQVTGGWMGLEIYYQDNPLTVTHNVVDDAIVGVDVGGRTANTLIAGNRIDGSGVPTATGIVVETWGHGDTDAGTAATLHGNDIYHTQRGLALLSGSGLAITATLEGNLISDTLSSSVVITGPGSIDLTLGDSLAAANTFRGHHGYLVQLIDAADDVPARFNDWGVTDLGGIEASIYHQVDDAALGEVNYYDIGAGADPASVPADGSSFAVVTGTLSGLYDPAGNTVTFSTSLGSVDPVSATTSPDAAATHASSSVQGTATVRASAGYKSATTDVTFTASALDHFAFAPVGDQVVGVPFAVTITARDSGDGLVSDYNGYVDLSDTTASVAPASLGPFSGGSWSGLITITQAHTADVLTATHPVNTAIVGSSNTFVVKLPTTILYLPIVSKH
ncbi:MAG: right-handed parallel beta-helix repeat-containing protein [Anaerolineae bacterium]